MPLSIQHIWMRVCWVHSVQPLPREDHGGHRDIQLGGRLSSASETSQRFIKEVGSPGFSR